MTFTIKQLEEMRAAGKILDFKYPEGKSDAIATRRKYGNEKVELDGHTFDSKKEARRYVELRALQSSGEISCLNCQTIFELSVCKYIADFTYKNADGNLIVEDVKSNNTRRLAVYRMKKKLMISELGIMIIEK